MAGFNTYAHVGNNPLLFVDPIGLAAHLPLVEYGGNSQNQALYDWAQSYQPNDFNTVVVHGTPDGQLTDNGYGINPPEAAAQLLMNMQGYDPYLPTHHSAGERIAGLFTLESVRTGWSASNGG